MNNHKPFKPIREPNFAFRLTLIEKEAIRDRAFVEKKTPSQVMREAVRQYLSPPQQHEAEHKARRLKAAENIHSDLNKEQLRLL